MRQHIIKSNGKWTNLIGVNSVLKMLFYSVIVTISYLFMTYQNMNF